MTDVRRVQSLHQHSSKLEELRLESIIAVPSCSAAAAAMDRVRNIIS